jgi:hypothetical protein
VYVRAIDPRRRPLPASSAALVRAVCRWRSATSSLHWAGRSRFRPRSRRRPRVTFRPA